jgi:hypothetical protein
MKGWEIPICVGAMVDALSQWQNGENAVETRHGDLVFVAALIAVITNYSITALPYTNLLGRQLPSSVSSHLNTPCFV